MHGQPYVACCWVARAIKYYGGDEVAFSSQGEASTSEGYVYEALNGASREKLRLYLSFRTTDLVFSVPVTQQSANTRISDNYVGLKHLKIVNVDGTDFVDSYQGMQAAVEYALSGEGPALVHAQCERLGAHSNSDRHELYRTKEEIEALQEQDPLAALRAKVIEAGILSEEDVLKMEADNEATLAEDAEAAEKSTQTQNLSPRL